MLRCGIRNVDTDFNNGCRYQYICFPRRKARHNSVHKQLVAVGFGRCGGGLLLFEALQQHMQLLRGALAGPYEVDEILSGVFHVQQHIAVVVQYDVLPEYLHSLLDVRLQQTAIAAVHAGHVQPGTFFGEFVYQRMPGFDGSGCCLG